VPVIRDGGGGAGEDRAVVRRRAAVLFRRCRAIVVSLRREVESAREIFTEKFGAADRSMSLITDVETWDDVPLASMTNLTRVLVGVGRKMNKERDVLVLFFTSHGTQ
jgi:hypothetical protein